MIDVASGLHKTMKKTVLLFTATLSLVLLDSRLALAASSTSKPGAPIPEPDPRARAIPELVCTGEQTVTVTHEPLVSNSAKTPLRLRIRGNLLYIGESANSEKFSGIINRTDTRRWIADNGTLVLDADLKSGAWVRIQLLSTSITAVRCVPFESSNR